MSKLRAEMVSFAVAGVAGLVADVGVLYLALGLGAGYYGGRVLSFLAAVWVTWQINRRYTFKPDAEGGSLWAEWWRYLSAMLGGGAVNYAGYSIAVALLPPHPLLPLVAVAAGSVGGMFVNFISAKFYVFRQR